jgi:hypothetical protein
MKNTIIALVVIILVALGAYYFVLKSPGTPVTTTPTGNTGVNTEQSTTTGSVMQEDKSQTVIGKSVEGRDIVAYHFGTGDKEILFVGGIHGGYEWNTSLVAYEFIEYLVANPQAVPAGEKVTVIPVLNPDGLKKVVDAEGKFEASAVTASLAASVPGRFNANTVDLNRNFDCDWKATGTWQNKSVSGGSAAFSEPESQAIRDYVRANVLAGVVVWYSAAGGVYASSCHGGVLPETTTMTKVYAQASGYPAHQSFDFYAITGDMVNWLAKNNIPAISVLLTNHTDTEWAKNRAGVEAILKHFAQ